MGADAVARDTESGVGGVEKERRKVRHAVSRVPPVSGPGGPVFDGAAVTTARRFWRPLSLSTATRGRGRNRGRQARSVAREAESLACSAPLPEPCGDKNQNVLVSGATDHFRRTIQFVGVVRTSDQLNRETSEQWA